MFCFFYGYADKSHWKAISYLTVSLKINDRRTFEYFKKLRIKLNKYYLICPFSHYSLVSQRNSVLFKT